MPHTVAAISGRKHFAPISATSISAILSNMPGTSTPKNANSISAKTQSANHGTINEDRLLNTTDDKVTFSALLLFSLGTTTLSGTSVTTQRRCASINTDY